MVEQRCTNALTLIIGMDRKLPESGSAWIGPARIGCFVSYEERNNRNEFILPEYPSMITFSIIFYFYVFGRLVRPQYPMP